MSIDSDASCPAAASARPAAHSGLYSPWAHVVRRDADAATSSSALPILRPEPSDRSQPQAADGSDTSFSLSSVDARHRPPPPPEEDADSGSNGNAAAGSRGKKPVWSIPSPNDAGDVGPVMGAIAWPALSESARGTAPRSSSSDSLKDKLIAPGPVISSPQLMTHANSPRPVNTPNHAVPSYQKPNSNPVEMKRESGGSGSSSSSSVNGEAISPLPSPAFAEMPPVGSGKHPQFSSKNLPNKGNNFWDRPHGGGFTSQPHSGSDHRRGYNGNRRGNNGGDGVRMHHGAHVNRRDHERGGLDWNATRGFYGRDPQMPMPMAMPMPMPLPLHQQRGHSRPFLRAPPPAPVSFIGVPPQARHLGLAFPDYVYYVPASHPVEAMMSVPFITQVPPAVPSPVFIPSAVDDPRQSLLKQIDYYFSTDNLCRDIFLRENMDSEGWVPVSLIATFNRVKELTRSIPYILDILQGSTVVEIQGEKIRRRGDWKKWILPRMSNEHNYDSLSTRLQSNRLEGGSSNQISISDLTPSETGHSVSAPGNFNEIHDSDVTRERNGSATSLMEG